MRKKRLLLVVLIIVNLLFIWGNSVLSQQQSHAISMSLKNFLTHLLPFDFSSVNFNSEHYLRKAAHVFEYLVLGVLLTLCFGKFRLKNCLMIIAAGVIVASLDETIQIFTERGPAVKDVMIDICGFMIGFIAVMALKRRHVRALSLQSDLSARYNGKR